MIVERTINVPKKVKVVVCDMCHTDVIERSDIYVCGIKQVASPQMSYNFHLCWECAERLRQMLAYPDAEGLTEMEQRALFKVLSA